MALPENEPGYRVPPGPAPRSASTPRPAVVDLGNGYSIVYLELAEGGPQIIKNAQADGPAARNDPDLGAKQAFEREQNAINLALQQARLAEDRRQYDETFGYQKARFNSEFPLQESQATGYYKGAPTLDRERFGENQYQHDSTQAIDYYKDLMNRVSNPRNFVQSYFERRGFAAPADAAKYGNTAPGERPWTIGSLQQFLPSFLNTARAVRGTAPQQTQTSVPAAQTFMLPPAVTAAPQGTTTELRRPAGPGAFPGMPFTGTPNTSGGYDNIQAQGNFALHTNPLVNNGKQQAISLANGMSFDDFAKRLAPNDENSKVAAYARGGIVPEPVVGQGLVSGQTYTFGERGPEGIVPAEMLPRFLRRRGGRGSYALGGLIGYDGYLEPTPPPAYSYDPPPSENYSEGGDVYSENYSEGGGQLTMAPTPPPPPVSQYDYSQGDLAPVVNTAASAPQLPSTTTGPAGSLPSTSTVIPPAQPFALTPEQQADIQRQIAETAARNRQTTTTTPPIEDPAARARREAEERARQEAERQRQEAERLRGIQQPVHVPQGPTTAQPVAGVGGTNPFTGQLATNRTASAPGTFGRSIPGAGPQFLAGEDQQSPIAQLAASGALPPFVTRLLAQSAGVHNQSTSTPQRFDLPPDLPLISSLAYQQMLPSERAGLESLLSAYGIDPSDYFSMVEAYSPQGPRAESPLFGARLNPYRQ